MDIDWVFGGLWMMFGDVFVIWVVWGKFLDKFGLGFLVV